MANPALLQQFFTELDKSPNFKYLPPEEQQQIKDRYTNAADEEVQRGIEIVQKDTTETNKEIQELAKKKEEEAVREKAEKREKLRAEIKEHEKIEKEESETKSREILAKLMEIDEGGDADAEKKKRKRKKLFGIF